MSTPPEPLPEAFDDFAPGAGPILRAEPDPDDPPWSAAAAFLLWVGSMFILILVPLSALLGYLLWRGRPLTPQSIDAAIKHDPEAVLASVVANLPAHLLTVALVWLLVTGAGRRPFWRTLGWGWGRHFGPWTSAATAVVLLLVGLLLVALLKGGKTPFDEMLESSAATRFTAVVMATVTAPLVEELVYRGVLYPAVRRATNTAFAVVLVSGLFTFVHVQQYYNNAGVIAAVATLSVALTVVRAATGRLLPCVVIHAVFNGLQCLYLVYEYFYPLAPPADTEHPMPALLLAQAALLLAPAGAPPF